LLQCKIYESCIKQNLYKIIQYRSVDDVLARGCVQIVNK
jgi:hypothetical protein